MDENNFGFTERQNILCLDNYLNYRKLLQHIINGNDKNTDNAKPKVIKLISIDYEMTQKIN
jgi:hypothetical protein